MRHTVRRIHRPVTGQDTGGTGAAFIPGAGRPLEPATRRLLEMRFDTELGDLRIHTGSVAAAQAQRLSARAYTLGRDIVFGDGWYAPQTREGQSRLAHEVTHALQQSHDAGPALGHAQREAQARQAADHLHDAGPMPQISAASAAISRDPVPGTEDDASFEATLAEASCDMGALCRIHFAAPAVVNQTRLLQAYRTCHPGARLTDLVAGNPCLTPGAVAPIRPGPVAPGPRRTPGTATPGSGPAAPAAAPAGGLALPSTTIAFNLGAAAVTIDLPASLALRLPVPFRGAERVVFTLNASPSAFSFNVTINAVPHVRIMAQASMSTEGRGAVGLTVQTTRTVCRAVDAAAARTALEAAGTRLRDAIQAVQTPPPPDPEASEVSRTFAPQARLAEVVGAIAKVHSEIERVGAPCREVPVASFDFGAQGQLTTPGAPPSSGALPPANFIGGSLRLHF